MLHAISRANISSGKDQTGLTMSDQKRQMDSLLIQRNGCRCLMWNVTVVDTMTQLYFFFAFISANARAKFTVCIQTNFKYDILTKKKLGMSTVKLLPPGWPRAPLFFVTFVSALFHIRNFQMLFSAYSVTSLTHRPPLAHEQFKDVLYI